MAAVLPAAGQQAGTDRCGRLLPYRARHVGDAQTGAGGDVAQRGSRGIGPKETEGADTVPAPSASAGAKTRPATPRPPDSVC